MSRRGEQGRRQEKGELFFPPLFFAPVFFSSTSLLPPPPPKKKKKNSYQQAHPEGVDVDAVVVVLVVELRRHELGRAQHRLRRGPRAEQRRQAEVADLDDALAAVDEDVVALEVAVDDRRRVAVQVHQAAQNLPGPPLEHLDVDRPLVLLPVLPERPRGEQLGDEVDGRVRVVEPAVVEGHDVAVLQLFQDADLREEPVALGGAARRLADELGHSDLVPGDFRAFLLVESLVDRLEGAAAEDLVELLF